MFLTAALSEAKGTPGSYSYPAVTFCPPHFLKRDVSDPLRTICLFLSYTFISLSSDLPFNRPGNITEHYFVVVAMANNYPVQTYTWRSYGSPPRWIIYTKASWREPGQPYPKTSSPQEITAVPSSTRIGSMVQRLLLQSLVASIFLGPNNMHRCEAQIFYFFHTRDALHIWHSTTRLVLSVAEASELWKKALRKLTYLPH